MPRSKRDLDLPPGATVRAINPAVMVTVPSARPRRSKYRAVKTEYKGRYYDSKAEARRAEELNIMQELGHIQWWHPKPGSFHLGCPENTYRPDFLVVSRNGVWCEDVKGVETAKFKRDKRLWAAYGPCPLHVITRSGTDVIIPKTKG